MTEHTFDMECLCVCCIIFLSGQPNFSIGECLDAKSKFFTIGQTVRAKKIFEITQNFTLSVYNITKKNYTYP